jgi:hypothetical protein
VFAVLKHSAAFPNPSIPPSLVLTETRRPHHDHSIALFLRHILAQSKRQPGPSTLVADSTPLAFCCTQLEKFGKSPILSSLAPSKSALPGKSRRYGSRSPLCGICTRARRCYTSGPSICRASSLWRPLVGGMVAAVVALDPEQRRDAHALHCHQSPTWSVCNFLIEIFHLSPSLWSLCTSSLIPAFHHSSSLAASFFSNSVTHPTCCLALHFHPT